MMKEASCDDREAEKHSVMCLYLEIQYMQYLKQCAVDCRIKAWLDPVR